LERCGCCRLTHQNKTQIWEIIQDKELVEKAKEVESKREKHVRKNNVNSKFSR